ncbi:MAG: hypothetical protein KGS44_16145, partial [Alphaproteobacteria bacterium]|nr:hypothetical protein [Alphaproteobacteria bacterium]
MAELFEVIGVRVLGWLAALGAPTIPMGPAAIGAALIGGCGAIVFFVVLWWLLASQGEKQSFQKALAPFWTTFKAAVINPAKGAQIGFEQAQKVAQDLLGQPTGGPSAKIQAALEDALWKAARAERKRASKAMRAQMDAALIKAAAAALPMDQLAELYPDETKITAAFLKAAEVAIADRCDYLAVRDVLAAVYPALLRQEDVVNRLVPALTAAARDAGRRAVEAANSGREAAEGAQSNTETLMAWLPGFHPTGLTKLEPYAMARLTNNRPTALLVADFGVIPYDDSRGLLGKINDGKPETLLGWATAGGGVEARLYAAAGGYGKTRLALEAVEALNKTGRWKAGLLNRNRLAEALAMPPQGGPSPFEAQLRARGDKCLFLAIDYAETRIEQLKQLAETLANAPSGGAVRVVLLARGDGWWAPFLDGLTEKQKGVFQRQPLAAIETEIAPVHRPAFFADACVAFEDKLRAANPALVNPNWQTSPADLDRYLNQGSPLFLAFQAFLHVRGAALDVSPLAAMAGEEREHLRRALKGDARLVAAAQRTAALVTLCQGLSQSQLQADVLTKLTELAITQDPALVGDDAKAKVRSADTISAALTTLYQSGPWLQPILPDILGERIVAEALTRSPGLLDAYFTAHDEDARNAFTVLNRISRSGPDGAPVHDADVMEATQAEVKAALGGAALAKLADPAAAAMNAENGNLQIPALAALNVMNGQERATAAMALVRAGARHLNPNATPARLRALFGEAAKASAEDVAPPSQSKGEDIMLRRQRADDADSRATALSNAGDRQGALAAAQEAVALYRALAKENPQAFTPNLAG